ncbi:hypothetical protein SAMN05444695_11786 [Rhodococcus triatomae]|uniref:Uncharacterized protein n=1 Tax=Rhodococcus triatomae TaxID=300028 RepID=A0A1G8RF30_9NOCA|nr:hypothetical protein SAMN05444695_11786 [Rhodococcus triatomae]
MVYLSWRMGVEPVHEPAGIIMRIGEHTRQGMYEQAKRASS